MADRRILSKITVSDILSDTGETEIAAPEEKRMSDTDSVTFRIAGTDVVAPAGAVLMTMQTHPVLGCLSAQFQISQPAGDGRPGDGQTYTWRRDTSDIPVAAGPEQPTEGPTVHSRASSYR